jgi:hypothetical protein
MGSHEERQTEEIFRSANELVDAAAEQSAQNTGKIPYICECADHLCLGRVELTRTEYEGVRRHTDRFVIIAGHLQAEGQHVVGMLGPYELVEEE